MVAIVLNTPLKDHPDEFTATLASLTIQETLLWVLMPTKANSKYQPASWPSGKASVSGAGDRRFESCVGRFLDFLPALQTRSRKEKMSNNFRP